MNASLHALAPFPQYVSFTVTHRCGLHCVMCGQWGPHGYLRNSPPAEERTLTAADFCKLAEDVASEGKVSVLLRGGEPFQLPGIMDLIGSIRTLELPLSIDTNGVHLEQFADELARIGGLHVTISVDGPEAIHDEVRGVKGTFRRLAEGIKAVKAAALVRGTRISLSLNFTLSPTSLPGLALLPDVARSLGVSVLSVVPYYWVPPDVGQDYADELRTLGSPCWSWRGFPHDAPAINPQELLTQLAAFRSNLGNVYAYPFMVLTDKQYVAWFEDARSPVGLNHCNNPWKLLDVQPNGNVNFCVDFPDYVLGNVRSASLVELWNSSRATAFRKRLAEGLLPICRRCGAKYVSELV